MKTELLIPFEPAKKDPTFMIKMRTGKKMNALERDMYFHWLHNKKLEELKDY